MNGISLMRMAAFGAVVAVQSVASGATEWHVYSAETEGMTGVQQLTNAFKQAKAGDTITIHAGTYNMTDSTEMMDPYLTTPAQIESGIPGENGTCYVSKVADLTVQGAPECTRDEVVVSGLGTNTVSNYGYRRVFHLQGERTLLRNLTMAHGNCAYGRQIGGKWESYNYARGAGVMFDKKSSIASNCVFRYCYAKQGAATMSGSIIDCRIENSLSSWSVLWPVEVRGCEFNSCKVAIRGSEGKVTGCTFDSCDGDGASGVVSDTSAIISNCTFTSCKSGVCIGYKAGRTEPITDCIFSNNEYSKTVASCMSGFSSPIVRCKFTGKQDFLADCTNVEACEFYSNGSNWTGINGETGKVNTDATPVRRCAVKRCSFKDFNFRWGAVMIDPISVESCLFTGNVCWGNNWCGIMEFTSAATADIPFVNCTIVTNQCNAMFGVESNLTMNCKVLLKNTLFHNNKVGGQSYGYNDFWDSSTILANCYFTNCVVKAANDSRTAETLNGNSPNLLNKNFDPKFNLEKCPEHPYSLKRKSPCVNAGYVESWPADSKDLAGKGRVHGSAVDIGCYENWDEPPGLLLFFR